MTADFGADPAFVPSGSSHSSGVSTKGFDPARMAALFAAIDKADQADRDCPARRMALGVRVCPRCKATSNESCGPVALAEWEIVTAARAIATEARRAATGNTDAVHEGAGGNAASPKTSHPHRWPPTSSPQRHAQMADAA